MSMCLALKRKEEFMKRIGILLCLLLIPTICFSVTTPSPMPLPKKDLQDVPNTIFQSTRQIKWAQLVGKWFGSLNLEGGGKYMWIMERKNDGTYRVQFRVKDPSGKIINKIEVGEWGVSGNIYFTIYKGDLEEGKIVPVDTTDPTYRDAYQILKLTSENFEYEALDEVARFSARKVASDFTFPE
jgi:hypothetical protein